MILVLGPTTKFIGVVGWNDGLGISFITRNHLVVCQTDELLIAAYRFSILNDLELERLLSYLEDVFALQYGYLVDEPL